MPAPIIAAFDPYTADRAPVALAVAAAEMTGSTVVAVAVYPWTLTDDATDSSDLEEGVQRLVRTALQEVHDEFGVETEIVSDLSVPRGLHLIAREKQAGLIVVGSTDRSRAGRVLVGSTAERLIQGSPCPVALAPQGYEVRKIGTIAVGFVDSPEGHEALAAAHALAARSQARLRVVSVLHPSGGLDAALAAGLRPQRSVTLEGRHRRETQVALDRAVAALSPPVDVECEVHVDDPAEVLLKISEHVDLLVCGSRGYGPLRSVLLGGVSRRLVDASSCPVLVLPREAGRPLESLLDDAGTTAAR
jgi:nucleotide-binding universal stress UspA family protein